MLVPTIHGTIETMTEKSKFWVQVPCVFVVAFVLPAFFGANWVALFSGAVVAAIGVSVHVSKYGQTTMHLWRIRPAWLRRPRNAPVAGPGD